MRASAFKKSMRVASTKVKRPDNAGRRPKDELTANKRGWKKRHLFRVVGVVEHQHAMTRRR